MSDKIDLARKFLINKFNYEYKDYILNELAGDFACELSEDLKMTDALMAAYNLREQEVQRFRVALGAALKALETPSQIVDADMMYCVSDDEIQNRLPYKVAKELIKKITNVVFSRNKNTIIIIKQALQETTKE